MFSKEEVRDGRPIRRDQTNEKGTITMKLTVNMNVSVDGVMQGLGGQRRTAAAGSSAADGPCRTSIARPRP